MKFAHIADCHIGGWKEPKLSEVSSKVFFKAIDEIKGHKVDFLLIAGDLFNTSLPSIDKLKEVVSRLKELKDAGIPVYIIAGSHDFSPSGKTMIDVLEEAGLVINVVKGKVVEGKLKLNFTVDPATGAKITGMLGKKGSLDRVYYENLDKSNLENEDGYKIFMFHTALSEFRPSELEKMESAPLSLLPKGFNYYAGGHVHYIFSTEEEGYGMINYPGALFPNSFSELEKWKHGGYYLVDDSSATYNPVIVNEVISLVFDSEHYSPSELEKEMISKIKETDMGGKILTLRIKGMLESGRVADIDFSGMIELCYSQGAYVVLKNANALKTRELEEVKSETFAEASEAEDKMIKEHLGQIKVSFDEEDMARKLMKALDSEKMEGEKNADYEKRVIEEIRKVIY
jgi:DNA repair protein SbcD/Mre11